MFPALKPANLQAFNVVQSGTQNINACPRYLISGYYEEIDPATGGWHITADYRGAAALDFPNVLKTMTAAQIDFLVHRWSPDILAIKAGVLTVS